MHNSCTYCRYHHHCHHTFYFNNITPCSTYSTSSGNNDIIVATPGRMVGHLKETPGFSDQMKGNRTVTVTKLTFTV